MAQQGFAPIGTGSEWAAREKPFTGVLHGNGHTIRNLFIHRSEGFCIGLVGLLGSGGIVCNLKLLDVTVMGGKGVGSLVGANLDSIVTGCQVSGNVTGTEDVGGLIGGSDFGLSKSQAYCKVTGGKNIGGLAGSCGGISMTTDCLASGEVRGNRFVGGLVGFNQGKINDSQAIGNVTGESCVGGLVGKNNCGSGFEGSIIRCKASCKVIGKSQVGALTGENEGRISECAVSDPNIAGSI